MNDSFEFQDVESICCGKTIQRSPVNRQLFPVLDLCWAATKACGLKHGTCLVHRENVFGSPFAPIYSSSTPYSGMLHSWNLNAADGIPVRESTGNHRPWILSFQQKDHIHWITWLINKDFRSRSFNLTNSPTPSTFSCWKVRFKTQVSACSDSPSEAMLWIREVEMVDSVDD